MFKLFEKESIIAYLIFILLVVLLAGKIYNSEIVQIASHNSVFFTYLLNVNEWSVFTVKIFVFMIILANFFIFSTLYKHFNYHSKGGLVFLFILCVHTILTFIFPVNLEHILVGFLFLILSQMLIQTDQMRETVNTFFNLGFVFSLSFLASSSMLFYLPPMLFSILIFGKNGIRDLWAMIIGIGATFFILASFIIIFHSGGQLLKLVSLGLDLNYQLPFMWEWLFFGITVLSAFLAFPQINLFTISTRKFYIYLFICFLSIISIFVIFNFNGSKNYYLVMILASFYLSPFVFKTKSNRMKNLLLFLGLFIAILATFVQLK